MSKPADTAGGQGADTERAPARLSTADAAEIAGVDVRTIRRAITSGKLAAVEQDGAYRVNPAALAAWQANRGKNRPAGVGADRARTDEGARPQAPNWQRLYEQERDERLKTQVKVDELNKRLADVLTGMVREQSDYLHALTSGRSDVLDADASTRAPEPRSDAIAPEPTPDTSPMDARPWWKRWFGLA